MSVKQKVTLIISTLAVGLLLLVFFNSKTFIVRNTEKVEAQKAENSTENAIDILKYDLDSVNSACGDWASWNETYNFIKDRNSDYINSYLDATSLSTLRVHTIAFVDLNGRIVFDRTFDASYEDEIDMPKELKESIVLDNHILKQKSNKEIISGIMMVDHKPMLISSIPVTNTEGERDGTLIMGRFLEDSHVAWINDVIDARLSLSESTDYSVEPGHHPIYDLKNYNIYSEISSNKFSDGYAEIRDDDCNNILILDVKAERVILKEITYSFNRFMIIFSGLLLVFTIFTLIAFQKLIINRIYKVDNFIRNIKSFEDINSRISIKGRDEIATLANATNSMLNELELSNERILENEERLRLVLEGTRDGFWDLMISDGEVYISSHIAEIIGLAKEDMFINFKRFKNILQKAGLGDLITEYKEILRNDKDGNFTIERKVMTNGREIWVSIKGHAVVWDSYGNPVRMAGILTDITEKKKSEETISYLSSHDVLTGLNNRACYNISLTKLDSEDNLPLSILLFDANGLKIVNDAFGHRAGDELLKSISSILQGACRPQDVAARLGGDEFSIILPKTDEAAADFIIDSIMNACKNAEANPIRPSLAVGSVTKKSSEEDINKLIDKAEDRMYRNKLLEDKSARHSIIASLESSLAETDYETREHTARLQDLAVKLGRSINLSKDKIDELSLLGSLHDIGKIAIPKSILLKPGALNEEEWEIIKKHCEIGYRIALSSVELVTIADYILTHHEKWDGSGYPKKLKGEQIPLLARIISIVDAYDVITNSRPYKNALSHEEAIKEIERCSGTHFDPYLAQQFIELFDGKELLA